MNARQQFVALFALGTAAAPFAAPAAHAQADSYQSRIVWSATRANEASPEVAFQCVSSYEVYVNYLDGNDRRTSHGTIPHAIMLPVNSERGVTLLTVPMQLIVDESVARDARSDSQRSFVPIGRSGLYLETTGNTGIDRQRGRSLFPSAVVQGNAVFAEEGEVNEATGRVTPVVGARAINPGNLQSVADALVFEQDVQYARRVGPGNTYPDMALFACISEGATLPEATTRQPRADMTFRRYEPDTSFYPGAGLPRPGELMRPSDLRRFRDLILPRGGRRHD